MLQIGTSVADFTSSAGLTLFGEKKLEPKGFLSGNSRPCSCSFGMRNWDKPIKNFPCRPGVGWADPADTIWHYYTLWL